MKFCSESHTLGGRGESQRPSKDSKQSHSKPHSVDTLQTHSIDYHWRIAPKLGTHVTTTRGQIMLKLKRGNSFTYHFVDDLMFLGVMNPVPLADGPRPVLSPPSTDHDASVNQCSDNRPCVWDLAGQCAFWAWLLPTHMVSPMCGRSCHTTNFTQNVSGRAVFSKQLFCAVLYLQGSDI